MNKRRLTLMIALAAVAAAGVAVATGSHSAERKADDQPTLDALMRVDISPLTTKLERIEAEIILLRTTAESANEKMEAMQEHMSKMEQALAQLRPVKYQYHFLYSTSNVAVNRLAEDGWELVTSGKDNLLIFRKPAPAKEDKEAQP